MAAWVGSTAAQLNAQENPAEEDKSSPKLRQEFGIYWTAIRKLIQG